MLTPVRALLLLVLIAIPLFEIALLVQVGRSIGFWPTIGLILAAAIGGGALIRRQGLGTLQRMMEAASDGTLPVASLLDGMLLIVAGVLLVVPGLITDAFGLVLLLPPVRAFLVGKVLAKAVVGGTFATWDAEDVETVRDPREAGRERTSPYRGDDGGVIIEGEYHRIEEDGDEETRSAGKRRN